MRTVPAMVAGTQGMSEAGIQGSALPHGGGAHILRAILRPVF